MKYILAARAFADCKQTIWILHTVDKLGLKHLVFLIVSCCDTAQTSVLKPMNVHHDSFSVVVHLTTP